MGVWSTVTTRSMMLPALDRVVRALASRSAPKKRLRAARSRISNIRDDLPEPETPVTATSLPNGMRTVMFFRLCSRAPQMTSAPPLPPARRKHRQPLPPREEVPRR